MLLLCVGVVLLLSFCLAGALAQRLSADMARTVERYGPRDDEEPDWWPAFEADLRAYMAERTRA